MEGHDFEDTHRIYAKYENQFLVSNQLTDKQVEKIIRGSYSAYLPLESSVQTISPISIPSTISPVVISPSMGFGSDEVGDAVTVSASTVERSLPQLKQLGHILGLSHVLPMSHGTSAKAQSQEEKVQEFAEEFVDQVNDTLEIESKESEATHILKGATLAFTGSIFTNHILPLTGWVSNSFSSNLLNAGFQELMGAKAFYDGFMKTYTSLDQLDHKIAKEGVWAVAEESIHYPFGSVHSVMSATGFSLSNIISGVGVSLFLKSITTSFGAPKSVVPAIALCAGASWGLDYAFDFNEKIEQGTDAVVDWADAKWQSYRVTA